MKPLARNSLQILLAIVLIVLALLLYLRFGAARVHHDKIEAAISEAVGLDVSVSQPLSLKLGKQSEFIAADVSLSQGGRAVAQIGRIKLTVDTASAFSDVVAVDHFEVSDVSFDLAQMGDSASAAHGSTSALSGSASINTAGTKPNVSFQMTAGDVDLQFPDAESDSEADEQDVRLFSDEPIDLAVLRDLDLTAKVSAESIRLNEDRVSDVHVDVLINDGTLRVESLRLASGEGAIAGTFSLAPDGERLRLDANADIANLRIAAMAVEGQGPAELPPLSLTVELAGTGRSMHEIMAAANGTIKGRHGSGQLDLDTAGALFSDLVTSIVKTLNPLAEDREFTTLECGIYDIVIVDGIATAEDLAAQTDHLTVISSGTINLGTEEIDLTLSTKSREGLGLSLGGVANSFVKVGGTLKEPALNVDAAGSAATTGAAVATGGLSILAKSLWDRLSAEADLCAEEAPQEK